MPFLEDYLTYSSGNEAPQMFHVWAGCMAISSTIGRRVWLPFGKRAIYPNIYVLLVGNAGEGKSIAMYYYKSLMRAAEIESISGNVETPAGLWRYMAGQPNAKPPIPAPDMFLCESPTGVEFPCHPMTIFGNEFINFISLDPENWMNHLNDIYDQDQFVYRTKGGGKDQIDGPYICILAGLTTTFAQILHKTNIIGSGFARRALFQWGVRDFAHPVAFIEETPEQQAAFLRCVDHLNKLKKLSGPFTMTEDARAFYKTWYDKHSPEIPKQSPELRSWFTTKPDQLIKLSTLASLSESFDLVIKPHHLESILDLLGELESHLHKIFNSVGRNELAEVTAQIFNYIDLLTEPVSFLRLRIQFFRNMPNNHGVDKELKSCLEQLADEGRIHVCGLGLAKVPVSDTLYATPQVMSKYLDSMKSAGATVVRLPSAQGDSPQAGIFSTDPLTSLAATLNSPLSAANQVAPRPAGEIQIALPQRG